jgi:hypothetical protein
MQGTWVTPAVLYVANLITCFFHIVDRNGTFLSQAYQHISIPFAAMLSKTE